MWSDRISPQRFDTLVEQLRQVLPAPRPSTELFPSTAQLRGAATVDQMAELLNAESGFSLLTGDRGPLLLHKPLVTISYAKGVAVVSGLIKTVMIEAPAFDLLEAVLTAWQGPQGALLAGFLSYDLAAELEHLAPLPASSFDFPGFSLSLYDFALTQEAAGWTLSGTDAWRGKDGMPITLDEAEALIRRAASEPAQPALQAPLTDAPLRSQPDKQAFEAAVERTVASIHAGDIFQTNICRSIEASIGADAWQLFQRMRTISPARYEAFLRLPSPDPDNTSGNRSATAKDRSLLSISPELFLKLDGEVAESSPIKGTRPRGETKEQDQALVKELLSSEKDRAELAMIVDVVRNDLARVCSTGTVKVTAHAELMSLPTVHHSVSTVRGIMREKLGPVDLLRAAFPAASISGAPKIEAMKSAMREEGQLRGPCMGAIGWISMDGRMEFSVAIRTAFVSRGKVRYYAGCGITADSVPADEFEESRHKAAAFARALGAESDPNW